MFLNYPLVDAQKLFTFMVSPLLHTNLSHFLNPLTSIFWPIWSYLIIRILFCINFISTQNHLKSTQNHLKSILINPKHVEHPKSIIICPILGIFVAFSALETYRSIKSYQFDLSTVMALSARSNYHSHHLIFDIVDLSMLDHNTFNHLITLVVSIDVIMINPINQS